MVSGSRGDRPELEHPAGSIGIAVGKPRIANHRIVHFGHFGIESNLCRADPFAGFDGCAGFARLHRASGLARRERHKLTGHRHGNRGHAKGKGSVVVVSVPDVVADVVEKIIGKVAATHDRHFYPPCRASRVRSGRAAQQNSPRPLFSSLPLMNNSR